MKKTIHVPGIGVLCVITLLMVSITVQGDEEDNNEYEYGEEEGDYGEVFNPLRSIYWNITYNETLERARGHFMDPTSYYVIVDTPLNNSYTLYVPVLVHNDRLSPAMNYVEVIDFDEIYHEDCKIYGWLKNRVYPFVERLHFPEQGTVEIRFENTSKGLAMKIEGHGSCLIAINGSHYRRWWDGEEWKPTVSEVIGEVEVKGGYKYQSPSMENNISNIDARNMSNDIYADSICDAHWGPSYIGSWWVYCNKSTEQPLYFKTRFDIMQRNYSYGRRDIVEIWKPRPNDSSELVWDFTLENGWQVFEGHIQVESTVHLNLNHPLEEDDDSFLLPDFTTPLFILATTAVLVVMKGLKGREPKSKRVVCEA